MELKTLLLVLLLPAAALAAALTLILLRRVFRGFESHLTNLHTQLDSARDDHNVWADRVQLEISQVRTEVQAAHTETADLQNGASAELRSVADTGRSVSAKVDDLASRFTVLSASVDLLARTPAPPLFLNPLFAASRSESELLAMAESLAILRPLVPYPGWRTDAELHNADLGYRLRRWFWQHFHDLRRDAPVVLRWHDDTRLRVFLGNDISGQIYIAGCWEPNEFAFLDRILRPGMTLLDIGANDGVYTVFAAKRVGPEGAVWAFEPSRRELDRLQFNLKLNQLAARVFPVALAESAGQAQFTVAGYEHEGHNTLGAFAYSSVETGTAETVTLRRLDDIVAEDPPARIDVIKLDVEGAELRVLRGAIEAIQKYRPIILFEVSESSLRNQGATGAELVEFVRAQHYAIHVFDPATGVVVPASSSAQSDNMVGVPEEKSLPDAIRFPWNTT